MAQSKPEYETLKEFRTIAEKLVNKYPDVLDGIDSNLITCVGVKNKDPKEGKGPFEIKPVPYPIRLDNPFAYYIVVNSQEWDTFDLKHKAALVFDALCCISKEDDGKVVPFDLKDHSVVIRTLGVDYMKRADIPDIMGSNVVWKKE